MDPVTAAYQGGRAAMALVSLLIKLVKFVVDRIPVAVDAAQDQWDRWQERPTR